MYAYNPFINPEITKADSKQHAEQKFDKGLYFATGLGFSGKPHFFHELMNMLEVSELKRYAKKYRTDKNNIWIKLMVVDKARWQQEAFAKIELGEYDIHHPLHGVVVRTNELYDYLRKYQKKYVWDWLYSPI